VTLVVVEQLGQEIPVHSVLAVFTQHEPVPAAVVHGDQRRPDVPQHVVHVTGRVDLFAADLEQTLVGVQRPSGAGTSPAVRFPAPGAGKAVIQVPDAAHLDPGTADFTLTAMVKLNADEVSAGANVVQKGTFGGTTGGQWKLQVDGGVPSCRIAGVQNGLEVDAMATWSGSIAGAGWKFIECKRRGAVLSINVANSATPVDAPQDATMDITSSAKVFVGAKGTGTNNDQFHGAVDNVVFSVG